MAGRPSNIAATQPLLRLGLPLRQAGLVATHELNLHNVGILAYYGKRAVASYVFAMQKRLSYEAWVDVKILLEKA